MKAFASQISYFSASPSPYALHRVLGLRLPLRDAAQRQRRQHDAVRRRHWRYSATPRANVLHEEAIGVYDVTVEGRAVLSKDRD